VNKEMFHNESHKAENPFMLRQKTKRPVTADDRGALHSLSAGFFSLTIMNLFCYDFDNVLLSLALILR